VKKWWLSLELAAPKYSFSDFGSWEPADRQEGTGKSYSFIDFWLLEKGETAGKHDASACLSMAVLNY
jgi:hypothetical protein